MMVVLSAAGPPEFDPAALERFLRARLMDADGAVTLRRVAGGQSNPTFFATLGARRMVLRKKPAGAVLPSAHAVDREYRVISALAATDVPVPRAILYCDDASVVGTPFYLMERLEGRVFHSADLPGVAPAERGAMYLSMAETLARLHDVDPDAIGLGDFGRAGNYFERQVRAGPRSIRPPAGAMRRTSTRSAPGCPSICRRRSRHGCAMATIASAT